MAKFKVGDKVKVIMDEDPIRCICIGSIGVVTHASPYVNKEGIGYTVTFDVPAKESTTWRNVIIKTLDFEENQLELVPTEYPANVPIPKVFNVGDHIKIKGKEPYQNEIGVITRVDIVNTPYYTVSFDDKILNNIGEYFTNSNIELITEEPIFKVGELVLYKSSGWNNDSKDGSIKAIIIEIQYDNYEDMYYYYAASIDGSCKKYEGYENVFKKA